MCSRLSISPRATPSPGSQERGSHRKRCCINQRHEAMVVGLTDTLSCCHPGWGGIHSAQWPGVLLDHLVCINSTQAAIRAGYSAKTANRTASENLSKPDIADRISGLKADALVTKREVTKKVTTEKLVTERQIVEANTEVIAREKIYLKSLREPGTWLTVLHCNSVSLRPAAFTDRATTSYSVGSARRPPKAWIWEPPLRERVAGLRIQKHAAEWQTNPFRKLQFKKRYSSLKPRVTIRLALLLV